MSDISLDLKLKNGDFELLSNTESVLQDENLIVVSDKGKFQNNLLLGVGILKYLNGPNNILRIKNGIKTELKKDGITLKSVQIINSEIYIDSYKK